MHDNCNLRIVHYHVVEQFSSILKNIRNLIHKYWRKDDTWKGECPYTDKRRVRRLCVVSHFGRKKSTSVRSVLDYKSINTHRVPMILSQFNCTFRFLTAEMLVDRLEFDRYCSEDLQSSQLPRTKETDIGPFFLKYRFIYRTSDMYTTIISRHEQYRIKQRTFYL